MYQRLLQNFVTLPTTIAVSSKYLLMCGMERHYVLQLRFSLKGNNRSSKTMNVYAKKSTNSSLLL